MGLLRQVFVEMGQCMVAGCGRPRANKLRLRDPWRAREATGDHADMDDLGFAFAPSETGADSADEATLQFDATAESGLGVSDGIEPLVSPQWQSPP